MPTQGIPPLAPYDVKVPNWLSLLQDPRQTKVEILQLHRVLAGELAPARIPGVEASKFDPEKRGLHFIESRVVTLHFMSIFDLRSIVVQQAHLICNRRIVG
jgi:hypothetical protein